MQSPGTQLLRDVLTFTAVSSTMDGIGGAIARQCVTSDETLAALTGADQLLYKWIDRRDRTTITAPMELKERMVFLSSIETDPRGARATSSLTCISCRRLDWLLVVVRNTPSGRYWGA